MTSVIEVIPPSFRNVVLTGQAQFHFWPRYQRLGQDSTVKTRLVSQILYLGVAHAHSSIKASNHRFSHH